MPQATTRNTKPGDRPARKAPARRPPARRPRRRLPEEARVRWKGWLAVSVFGCIVVLGGLVVLDGVGFFRDIERAETLIVAGWIAVAMVSIFLTLAVRMLREKKHPSPLRPGEDS